MKPNKAMKPIPVSVTPPAIADAAPLTSMAHLCHSANSNPPAGDHGLRPIRFVPSPPSGLVVVEVLARQFVERGQDLKVFERLLDDLSLAAGRKAAAAGAKASAHLPVVAAADLKLVLGDKSVDQRGIAFASASSPSAYPARLTRLLSLLLSSLEISKTMSSLLRFLSCSRASS